MDIVERLRRVYGWSQEAEWCAEAADEIERLRGVLKDVLETSGEQIPYGTVKAIRSALKEKE